jgi:uncharacterized protein (TIGR03437 family)
VTTGQAAYVIPAGTAPGVATISVGGNTSAALIAPVAPGILFVPGTTIANALANRYSADGSTVTPEPVFQCTSSCTAAPLDLGSSTDILNIELYGTGLRNNSGMANWVAEIGGVPAQVVYAGAQSQYDGLDQVDIFVPHSLVGAGTVPIVLTIDGITANVVTVNFK